MDAVSEASKMGLDSGHAVNYKYDAKGVSLNYDCLSTAISEVRKNKKMSKSWGSAIDKDLETRKDD